jgi:hypothetical protein
LPEFDTAAELLEAFGKALPEGCHLIKSEDGEYQVETPKGLAAIDLECDATSAALTIYLMNVVIESKRNLHLNYWHDDGFTCQAESYAGYPTYDGNGPTRIWAVADLFCVLREKRIKLRAVK